MRCCDKDMASEFDEENMTVHHWCESCFSGDSVEYVLTTEQQDYWHCPLCKWDDYSMGADYEFAKDEIIETETCPCCGHKWVCVWKKREKVLNGKN